MSQELELKWNIPAISYWRWWGEVCFFFSLQLLCFPPFFSASAPASVFSCSVSLLGSSQASSFPAYTAVYPIPCNQLLHCDSSFALYLRLRRPLGWKTMVHFHTFSLISLPLSHSPEWMLIMTFSYLEMFRYGKRTSLLCLNQKQEQEDLWKLKVAHFHKVVLKAVFGELIGCHFLKRCVIFCNKYYV